MDIEAVNRAMEIAIRSDGKNVKIHRWLDVSGDECDPDEALCCVAGSDADGWWSIDLTKFNEAEIH